MPARVELDVDSVRHWLAVCRFGNADDPRLTNEMVRKLTAADVEPLFAPMRFLGWRRHKNGATTISKLAADRSNTFIFEVDADKARSYWVVDDVEAFIGKRRTQSLDAKVNAAEAALVPTKQDLAAARAALAKYKPSATEIALVASKKKDKLKVLPEEIEKYAKLQTLKLHFHDFTTLPDAIGLLKNLRYLEVEGGRLRTLPKAIGKLSKLETLSLDFTQVEALPDEIGKLTNLRYLSLNHCSALQRIPATLAKCKKLATLSMQYVPVRSDVARRIKRALPACEIDALPST